MSKVGTFTDLCGNVYDIIKLGDQYWFDSNWRCNRYADDTRMSSSVYKVYNGYPVYGELYGGLYKVGYTNEIDFFNNLGIRLPSITDVYQLQKHMGLALLDGKALKSTRSTPTVHPRWEYNATHVGTDSYGFSCLPGGCISGDAYSRLGRGSYMWLGDTDDYFFRKRKVWRMEWDLSRTLIDEFSITSLSNNFCSIRPILSDPKFADFDTPALKDEAIGILKAEYSDPLFSGMGI